MRFDMLVVACCVVALVLVQCDGVSFEGTFDSGTFSVSTGSQVQLGLSLKQYFAWTDVPLFSLFQGAGSPTPTTILVQFAFGSSDPSANQLQMTYSNALSNYIENDSNVTSFKGMLRDNGILLYSLIAVSTTPNPEPQPAAPESFLDEYYPVIIIGSIALVILVVVAIVFVVIKRRSVYDNQIYDAMEAMMSDDALAATGGVESIRTGAPKNSKPTKPVAAAPPPQQTV